MRQVSRIGLGSFPTPFQRHPGLGEVLDIDNLWIKRDDLTNYSWSGNKVRTIEFLLGDVVKRGSDAIIICGGPTSNFAALMTIACAARGIAVYRSVYGTEPTKIPKALAVSIEAGATIEYTGSADRQSMETLANLLADRLRRQGRDPYVIPRGGATAIGALGLANAAVELSEQLDRAGMTDVSIVLPVGSGGTIGGLIAGLSYLIGATDLADKIKIELIGVSVSRAPDINAYNDIRNLALSCMEYGGYQMHANNIEKCNWRLIDGRGCGFGIASEQDMALVEEIESFTGLQFDTTYNSKALSWLRNSNSLFSHPVVYWHTGGALGVEDRISARRLSAEDYASQMDRSLLVSVPLLV